MARAGESVPVPDLIAEPVLCRALQLTPLELAQLSPEQIAVHSGAADGLAIAQWLREQEYQDTHNG